MENTLYFNDKFHYLASNDKLNGWFSSFNIFKYQKAVNFYHFDERPPYPVLNDQATVSQVFFNLNKSDFLVFLTMLGAGQLVTLSVTKYFITLKSKFHVSNYLLSLYAITGMVLAMNCSFYRLAGLMDNGLRWKRQGHISNKYDLTKHYERNSIFKHFRERAD